MRKTITDLENKEIELTMLAEDRLLGGNRAEWERINQEISDLRDRLNVIRTDYQLRKQRYKAYAE